MEYQEGGSLSDILVRQVRFSEDEARLIAEQLLLTLDFMARKRIVHRDLKPENVLLHSNKKGVFDVRLADFGFATRL